MQTLRQLFSSIQYFDGTTFCNICPCNVNHRPIVKLKVHPVINRYTFPYKKSTGVGLRGAVQDLHYAIGCERELLHTKTWPIPVVT